MDEHIRNYLIITSSYWAFTITDGAIRMLVVLYFHLLGYSPLQVASLFLFYEFFGVITNALGGWLGTRIGLDKTLHLGMALQISALLALSVPEAWLSVPYVMAAQALSGIAKDLNKMSAKASVKTLARGQHRGQLFKWVSLLTGSKNALKGAGFFIGAALLEAWGFRSALWILAGSLGIVLVFSLWQLPSGVGRAATQPKFRQIFSNIPAINWLSAARFFLFGARDIWFVVALPVFLYTQLGWRFMAIGAFLAAWIIGYGMVQAATPSLLRQHNTYGHAASLWAGILALVPASMASMLQVSPSASWIVLMGVVIFGLVFAINSALHSYLILAYASHDKVAMNVGFYYMANAAGRLTGTLLSGWSYQQWGLVGSLWWAFGFVLLAAALALKLPEPRA